MTLASSSMTARAWPQRPERGRRGASAGSHVACWVPIDPARDQAEAVRRYRTQCPRISGNDHHNITAGIRGRDFTDEQLVTSGVNDGHPSKRQCSEHYEIVVPIRAGVDCHLAIREARADLTVRTSRAPFGTTPNAERKLRNNSTRSAPADGRPLRMGWGPQKLTLMPAPLPSDHRGS